MHLVPEIDSTRRAQHVEHLNGKNGQVKDRQPKKLKLMVKIRFFENLTKNDGFYMFQYD